MQKIFLLFFIFINQISKAQITIVPKPNSLKLGKEYFIIKDDVVFYPTNQTSNGDGGLLLFKNYLTTELKIKSIYTNNIPSSKSQPTSIYVNFTNDNTDGYSLVVSNNSIKIKGNEKGIFYAFETIKQLIETKKDGKKTIPYCIIEDAPRFAYRGMHLDVSRHFWSVAYIKKYIDYLATYKYNTFHWHLTDDQGWRIEIKKYPKLTTVGGYRDRTLIGKYGSGKYDNQKYGGYYTQVQIKEIVQYATSRYITVIPEIEMPGHSTAALASYPYLGCTKGPYKTMDTWGILDDVYCAGNDSTFTFLLNVLDEVIPLFPASYIHIGGDECPKARWKNCSACQKRITDNNLKNEEELQSNFIQTIEKYINSKGKKIIGWDEILEGGLAANATVMSWRGEEGGIAAAKEGHDVIMTPGSHCYLDHSQTRNEDSLTIGSYLPLDKIYNYEPIPAALNAEQAKHILGAQGNVWTEYIDNESKLEYMIFPRMIALSEALWTHKENKSYADFEKRLPAILQRLDNKKINYSKAYYDLNAFTMPTENNDGVYWVTKSKLKGGDFFVRANNIYKGTKSDTMFTLKVTTTDSVSVNKIAWNKITSLGQKFYFNKATGKAIILNTKADEPYIGDGPFTLVNGIQNTKGMAKSTEFLGFRGKDVELTIDFGKDVEVSNIKVHCLNKNNSWIYLPSEIEVTAIPFIDTTIITKHAPLESTTLKITSAENIQTIKLPSPKTCRSVRINIKNFGKIPAGNAGEGNGAWLFVSEIEVN